jgi:hypothetical protein
MQVLSAEQRLSSGIAKAHPLTWMRSRTSTRCGDVNKPVRWPQRRRIDSANAQVDPCGSSASAAPTQLLRQRHERRTLPLVPATCTTLSVFTAS